MLDFDYEGMPLMSLYRASDRLVRHRQAIEEALFSRIDNLFSLMLTDLEAVFRSLKSELGLRPIYHHKEHRAEGCLFIIRRCNSCAGNLKVMAS